MKTNHWIGCKFCKKAWNLSGAIAAWQANILQKKYSWVSCDQIHRSCILTMILLPIPINCAYLSAGHQIS